MKLSVRLSLALMALVPATMLAGPGAVNVIHGIPGLRVSVSVEGAGCAIPDFNFGDIAGPLPLPAATYLVSIHPGTGCTAAAIPGFARLPISVSDDENVAVIAHLTTDGTPFLSRFTNPVSTVYNGRARVILHHLAAAPDVDVRLDRMGMSSAIVPDFPNNSTNVTPALLELKPGRWDASIYVSGTETRAIGPLPLTLEANVTYLVYAIGSAAGPLDVKVIAVPGPR